MNNKTRIIIGVVIVVLFLIGIVALGQTQPINSSEPTKITNQNDTQIQNNSTDTIEIESNTVVKYSLNKDKSSKVNANSKNKSVDVASNEVNYRSNPMQVITDSIIAQGSEKHTYTIIKEDNKTPDLN